MYLEQKGHGLESSAEGVGSDEAWISFHGQPWSHCKSDQNDMVWFAFSKNNTLGGRVEKGSKGDLIANQRRPTEGYF